MTITTETREISSSDDVIDVRDVIARVEELEEQLCLEEGETKDGFEDEFDQQGYEELSLLRSLLQDLESNGGDEEWRGSWYPVTLIRESYFQNYAQELAEDIGAISSEHSWPLGCIDWERAADELLIDYTSTDYDGVTYYYR